MLSYLSAQRSQHLFFPLFCLALIAVLSAGCIDDDEENDSPVKELYQWAEFTLDESRGGLYGRTERPLLAWQEITFWFPNGWDAGNNNVSLTLLCLHENDSEIIGTPCTGTLTYDPMQDVYTGYFVPAYTGDWYFELTLHSPNAYEMSQDQVRVVQPDTHPRVKALNTSRFQQVLSVFEPANAQAGIQDFSVGIWSPQGGMLTFQQDTTFQLDLRVFKLLTGQESSSNIAPVHVGDGVYEGEVNFPSSGTWGVTLMNQFESFSDTLTTFYFTVN